MRLVILFSFSCYKTQFYLNITNSSEFCHKKYQILGIAAAKITPYLCIAIRNRKYIDNVLSTFFSAIDWDIFVKLNVVYVFINLLLLFYYCFSIQALSTAPKNLTQKHSKVFCCLFTNVHSLQTDVNNLLTKKQKNVNNYIKFLIHTYLYCW